MDCVITSATLHEGVLDLAATAVEGGGSPDAAMRFLMPKRVLEWNVGQRFRCHAVGHHEKSAATDAITLRGVVVDRDATATLLSFGGLPMRLPPSFPLGDDASVTLRLAPYCAQPKKRSLRPRPGAAVARGI